ncbi:MAG: DMT family transporter [Deltaproteobacteria bacterium]|nr:DMT family transporter [Deltaproteobacteria bacterium]
MNWFCYALLCAFFLATSDYFAKKTLKEVDVYTVAFGRLIWAAPIILCLFPFVTIPSLTPQFWFTFALLVPLDLGATILYTKAIKFSPLSLTTPFLGLTPLFLLFTSYFILGEIPDTAGFIGVVFVGLGAYALNIKQARFGILAPIKAIGKEKGSVLMIVVAVIYSLTAILGKICSQLSSPLFFSMVYIVIAPFCLLPLVLYKNTLAKIKQSFSHRGFILLGFFYGLMILCHMNAIVQVEVSYMISVKRCSLLFSILYGRLLLHEKGIYERFTGGVLIIIGIACITLL